MIRTIVVVVSLLSSPAFAADWNTYEVAPLPQRIDPAGMSMPGAILLPPPQYDHPFAGRVEVQTVSYWDVAETCGKKGLLNNPNGPGMRVEGCAKEVGGTCFMVLPALSDVGEETLADLIRHETAHCNDWLADHPNGRF